MNRYGIQGIDHVAMQLPNLGEGLLFYQEMLGCKVRLNVEFEGRRVVLLDAGKIEIEIWERKTWDEAPLEDASCGVHHIAFQVKDIERVLTGMKEAGVVVLAEIYEPTRGIREAIVQGPGGVRVQFVEQDIPLLIWRSLKGDFKEQAVFNHPG